MTTAASLIDKATALIGVRGVGQTLDGAVAADCFGMLSTMLDEWNLEPGMFRTVKRSFALIPNQREYELSPTGDFVMPTPVNVLSAYYRTASTDYPVDVVAENYYDSIPDKATTCNIPDSVFYDGLSLFFCPSPSEAGTITLTVKEYAPTFVNVSDDLSLEPGIESAIINNLAVAIAPMFEKQPSQTVMLAATRSKRLLKRQNFTPEAVDCPFGAGKAFNIYRGY